MIFTNDELSVYTWNLIDIKSAIKMQYIYIYVDFCWFKNWKCATECLDSKSHAHSFVIITVWLWKYVYLKRKW